MADENLATSTLKQPNSEILNNTTLNQNSLIAINSTQLPDKLTSSNYPSWKAQIDALLFGYDLIGYVDGTKPRPPKMISAKGKQTPNPDALLWKMQDKPFFHGILVSLRSS